MSKTNLILYSLLLLISLFVMAYKLSFSPVHLNQDEAMFALNAKSIAESGTDFYGNKWPFYFWHLDNFWATPIVVYFSSFFLKLLPFNEADIRISTVFLGVVDIGLVMYLVHLLFKKTNLSLVSGFLLLLTPAFFINSRLLLDNIYPVFFVILWLIFLMRKNYFLAGLSLGLGIHSYHAAKIYFPLYFLVTLAYTTLSEKISLRRNLIFVVGFLVPVLIFIPWLTKHPDTLTNQIGYASSIDRNLGSNLVTNYVSYFDPAILFTTGDRTLIHSTGKVGVFPFFYVIFIIFGILAILFYRKKDFWELILFGFLTYPIAPSIINDPGRISRALVIIPFGILLAVRGMDFLLSQRNKLFKYLTILLIISSVFQFFTFIKDYLGPYRTRSHTVFNDDIGGTFESALRSTKIRPVKTVYIDKNIFFAKYYFAFYEKKLNIYPQIVIYFDPTKDKISDFSSGSIVVLSEKSQDVGSFSIIEVIHEPGGDESYFIYWRDR